MTKQHAGTMNPRDMSYRSATCPISLGRIAPPMIDIKKKLRNPQATDSQPCAACQERDEGGGGRDAPFVNHGVDMRSRDHTSELQSPCNLVCRLLLEKKK